SHNAELAERWMKWYADRLEQFERLGRDIGGRFAEHGRDDNVSLLASAPSHAYLPLLLNDEMIAAQLTLRVKTAERHFARRPGGLWLPECAYRPALDQWLPAVLYNDARSRPGLETFVANTGADHFFVETHLIAT